MSNTNIIIVLTHKYSILKFHSIFLKCINLKFEWANNKYKLNKSLNVVLKIKQLIHISLFQTQHRFSKFVKNYEVNILTKHLLLTTS